MASASCSLVLSSLSRSGIRRGRTRKRELTLGGGLASIAQLTLWHPCNDPAGTDGHEPLNARTLARGAIDYVDIARVLGTSTTCVIAQLLE